MVTHLQTVYFQNRFAHSVQINPEFVETAEAMGVQARKCTSENDADEKLRWLLDTKGLALLEVMISPKALTLPMVPAGRGLHEFITYNNSAV